jgi:hypothetical protein
MTGRGDDVGIGEKLDEVIVLLQRLVALELSRRGVPGGYWQESSYRKGYSQPDAG